MQQHEGTPQHRLMCVHDCSVQVPGLVNVDFADVRAVMTGAGSSLMGQGRATGKARAREAAVAAISSPLLDLGIERAMGIVWNITGPPDMTLFEVWGTTPCLARRRGSGGVGECWGPRQRS
jgi:cell division GTPase FtsZ